MKTIFFRKFVIFLFFFSATSLLFSESENNLENQKSSYEFSTGLFLGMLHGTSFELVYKTPTIPLSELQWEIKPLFYIGSFLQFSQSNPIEKNGFYSKLTLKIGFPTESGFMEDRDWLATENNLSHFSKHTNTTNNTILFDISLGYSFSILSTIVITPLFGFHLMYYDWIAEDGYVQYAKDGNTWNNSLPQIPSKGSVVGYSQTWKILSFGLSIKYPFLKRFILEGSFLYSPFIWVDTIDNHFLRNTEGIRFYDKIERGYLLEPSLAFYIIFNQKIKLHLNASYRYINDSKGYSYAYDNKDNSFLNKSLAGAEYQVWDAAINVIFSF
jgi:outer membrane protease